MANNIISQYYTKNDGMQISNDYQFSILQGNEKIINKNSGEKFVKNPSYSNVFDKTNTFTDCLNDARSTSIANIDDATASGVCYCKNFSGTQIDTFTCHVPVNNSAPTLNWGQISTIGTVDGTPLTVKMPGNPNTDTKYSAGTGLTLSGTTFSISQEYFNNILRYDANDGNNGYYRYRVEHKEKGENIPPSAAGGSGKTYPISGWYIIGYSAQGHQSSYELISNKIDNTGSGSGEASGKSGWFKIGNILVQWMRISAYREVYYPYGTYVSPPLGFWAFCSTDYDTSFEATTSKNGVLQVSTDRCYYGQDEDNRFPNYISVLVIGVAASSLPAAASSLSAPETPTTHTKTYTTSGSELARYASAGTITDEEVFDFIKRKDPGAISIVNFETEYVQGPGLIRVTSITYYTTTA